VRYWHSWHRAITLAMMAHAWLTYIRQAGGENQPDPEPAELSLSKVRRVLEIAPPLPSRSPQLRLARSRLWLLA